MRTRTQHQSHTSSPHTMKIPFTHCLATWDTAHLHQPTAFVPLSSPLCHQTAQLIQSVREPIRGVRV